MNQLSAKEMFEKLGYTCVKNNCEIITYRYYTEKVCFDSEYKSVTVCDEGSDYDAQPMSFDIPTFKAIQKQLEELGWLEE